MPKRTMQIYRSYSFKDKDPVIDKMRTMITDEKTTYSQLAAESGVAMTTLYNWFTGPTRRPQFATVMAVVRTLGYDLQVTKTAKHVRGHLRIVK